MQVCKRAQCERVSTKYRTGQVPHLQHGLEAVRLRAEEVGLTAGVPRAHQQRVDIGTCTTMAMELLRMP